MPAKRKRPEGQQAKTNTEAIPTFRVELERALEHFTDPEWLGQHSPLAAPYMLDAAALPAEGKHSHERGRLLQQHLKATAELLTPSAETRYDPQQLLKLLFFEPDSQVNQNGLALRLGVSPATFYRHRLQALSEFEQQFASAFQPKIRLEMPQDRSLIGRESEFEWAMRSLLDHQIVALMGESGSGKTALGAALVHAWQINQQSPVFWYTIRLGVNDQFISLIYALAEFMRTNNAPTLWLQLLANRGQLDPQVAMGLAWECLSELSRDKTPLLCIDEIDLLSPRDHEPVMRHQLRNFIEGLVQGRPPHVAVLLLGQSAILEPNQQIVLNGLTVTHTSALLFAKGLVLPIADVERIQQATGGNLRLLHLIIAAHPSNESIESTLKVLLGPPSLKPILDRVLQRLTESERHTLSEIAAFPTPAPADVWADRASVLESLVERNLLQRDAQDTVQLQARLREVMRLCMSPESIANGHRHAATVCAARGEYTQAAFHLIQCQQFAAALHLWFAYRESEIARGQAGTALATITMIDRNSLPSEEQRIFVSLLSELQVLTGDTDLVLEDLASVTWPDQHPLVPRVLELRGAMMYRKGQLGSSVQLYEQALDSIAQQLPRVTVRLHAHLSRAYLQMRNLDRAWQEALLARTEAELQQGEVQEERGNYQQAEQHYNNGLEFAQASKNLELEALAHYQLGSLAMRFENVARATEHFERCTEFYERVGDRVKLNRTRTNIGAMLVQAQRFEEAIQPIGDALQFFEMVGHRNMIALNRSNLAEAQARLGQYAEATHNAELALQTEEEDIRPYALTTLGIICIAENRAHDAEHFLRDAIHYAQQAQDRWAEAAAMSELGRVLQSLGKVGAAHEVIRQALQIYVDLKLDKGIQRTLQLL